MQSTRILRLLLIVAAVVAAAALFMVAALATLLAAAVITATIIAAVIAAAVVAAARTAAATASLGDLGILGRNSGYGRRWSCSVVFDNWHRNNLGFLLSSQIARITGDCSCRDGRKEATDRQKEEIMRELHRKSRMVYWRNLARHSSFIPSNPHNGFEEVVLWWGGGVRSMG